MEHPPGGWMYTESFIPQWTAPPGSFDTVVRAVIALRQGNRALTAQHNKSTDYEVVSNEVDEFNAQRMLSHGWEAFVADGGTGPPNPVFSHPQRLRRSPGVVGIVRRAATVGVGMIRDLWLGDSLKPVSPELSEKRAQVCVVCPRHDGDKEFIDKLTAEAAKGVRALMQAKYDMELKTSVDDKLGMCRACGCVLPLKVHVSLEVAKKKLKPGDFEQLHETCWIRHET